MINNVSRYFHFDLLRRMNTLPREITLTWKYLPPFSSHLRDEGGGDWGGVGGGVGGGGCGEEAANSFLSE